MSIYNVLKLLISSRSLSFGKAILLALTIMFALCVMLAFARFGFIYWIYATIEDWTTMRLGFDYYVSNLIATLFTAVFSLLAPTLLWYFFLGKKQVWGIGATVGAQILICVSIYTLGRGVCFDRRTGKPLCYYADTSNGRIWSYSPGFDPATGKQFEIYTREIKQAEDERQTKIKIKR